MPYAYLPYEAVWFDCDCEPRKIICDDRAQIQQEFNQCEPKPPSCEAFVTEEFNGGCNGGYGFGYGGFGNGSFGCGSFGRGSFGSQKGWDDCYINGPKPEYEEPDCIEFSLLGDGDFCNPDPCYDPCSCNDLPT